ncbi:MAG TPA: acetate--CoA ligase family protein [Kiloniellales bacterium]
MPSTSRSDNLKRLLKPRHIAFFGGAALVEPIRSCESAGFEGEIWVVNPRREELAGRRCYRSVAELPEAPDASFVAVNREDTIAVVRDLAARGAGGAVAYAAGFAEIGAEGAALQRELVAAAGDELALIGPNCYGLLNYFDGVALWADQHGGRPLERGVAVVSQSGNISLNLTMAGRSVPLGYVISVGNQAALGIGDYLEALVEDPRISAIGLYIEGLSDVASFSRAAARALEKNVPIVALKVGTSDIGAQVALSHTSSLAGSDQLYEALFARLGIIRVASISGLLETLKLLAVVGPLAGPRLCVFTCSGGESALIADLAEPAGLEFSPLSREQADDLRRQMTVFTTIANPFDYNTAVWGNLAALERCFTTALRSGFDVGVLMIDYPDVEGCDASDWDISVEGFIAAHKATGCPAVVASTLPELLPQRTRERVLANGLAPLQGLSETVAALGAAAAYARRRTALLDNGGSAAPLHLPGPAKSAGEPRLLDEWEAKRRLAGHGLAVPEGRRVSGESAPAAAREIGFPVVLKAVGPDLAHKTEAGAVALELTSEAAVAAAVAEISANLARHNRGTDGFLVERMVEDAVAELIVGVKRDPVFGLALVLGSGGVLVELLRDSATLLLPTDRRSVERALATLKGAPLLAGFRGRPKGDMGALIDAVMAVAAFAEAHRASLAELDVNPLLVRPEGKGRMGGAVAVDALIRISE